MFYDNSEPEFPNWWAELNSASALDEGEREKPAGVGEHDADRVSGEDGGYSPGGGISETDHESPDFDEEDDRGRVREAGPETGAEDEYGWRTAESVEGEQRVESRIGDPRRSCSGYEREVILSVWEYAEIVPGNDPDLWRKDEFGAWIHRLDYGRRGSRFGWEIFDPGAGRRSQGVYVMRPMQWQSYVRRHEMLER